MIIRKVCHISTADVQGGVESQIRLFLSLAKADPRYEFHILLFNSGMLADELRRMGLPVHIIPETRWNQLQLLLQMRRIFASNRFEIVHTHKYKDHILGGIASVIAGVPTRIPTVHGLTEVYTGLAGLKQKVIYWVDCLISKLLFDRVIAVSSEIYETLKRWIPAQKLTLVHNAINLSRVKSPDRIQMIRNHLNRGKGTKLIGAMGRLVPVKGHRYFIEAASIILQRRNDVTFVLAGDGPLMGELKAMAERAGLGQKITFTGFVDNPADYLEAMDVFVLPSLSEGLPVVLLECMAVGTPVVATKVGGMAEILQHKITGYLVEPKSSSGIAAACLEILWDSNLRRQLERAARKFAQQHFSGPILCRKILSIYDGTMVNRAG